MTDVDPDFGLQRLFLVFGGGIALFLLFFFIRFLKVFFVGKRFRGIIARVRKTEYRGKPQYSYVVEYEDPLRGRRLAHERQTLPIQEFEKGDAVIIYTKDGDPRACEILSWPRVCISTFVLLLVILAMLASYRYSVG